MPLKNLNERKKYHKEYMRKWYKENKLRHLSYLKNLKDKLTKHIDEIKRSNFCVDCGISGSKYPKILDFHHVRGDKNFNISEHSQTTLSVKKIDEEIKKCDILCANCHRIRTIYKNRT